MILSVEEWRMLKNCEILIQTPGTCIIFNKVSREEGSRSGKYKPQQNPQVENGEN